MKPNGHAIKRTGYAREIAYYEEKAVTWQARADKHISEGRPRRAEPLRITAQFYRQKAEGLRTKNELLWTNPQSVEHTVSSILRKR